jgi:hypothetical protein
VHAGRASLLGLLRVHQQPAECAHVCDGVCVHVCVYACVCVCACTFLCSWVRLWRARMAAPQRTRHETHERDPHTCLRAATCCLKCCRSLLPVVAWPRGDGIDGEDDGGGSMPCSCEESSASERDLRTRSPDKLQFIAVHEGEHACTSQVQCGSKWSDAHHAKAAGTSTPSHILTV